MIARIAFVLLLLTLYDVPAATAQDNSTEALSGKKPSRNIRRDVPMTDAIMRAFDAGTRNQSGLPGENYWQLEVDQSIDVRLDPEAHRLEGKSSLVIHNNSPDALQEIVLRLDHNIFRADTPQLSIPAELTDGMVLTEIEIDGRSVDLASRPRGRGRGRGGNSSAQSDYATGLTSTVATIHLSQPIEAKSKATLNMSWHTVLPGGENGRGHRMTQRWGETLFQPTQWYPRLAKYDDMQGWERNIYLGPAEFFNNFGRFDVRIDVPAGWIVSGTGVLQNPEEVLTDIARERLSKVLDSNDEITIVGEDEVGPGKSTQDGDRLVWHFVADKVNDFAWATAENFVWQATRATIPEKGPVPIYMYYLPESAPRYQRAGAISRHALEFYSQLWAPYPFPQLSMQDGPSAGMEYPMVINSNQGAADHEVGHQWWPMMLGTNETSYGWMDEGLNTYMNILSAADTRRLPPNLNGYGQRYGRVSGNENEPPMMWTANYAGSMYSYQTYSKAPCMLSMLGAMVGDEQVQQAIREYTHEWAFKHPSPWDFINSMNRSLERDDLGWFWYYWLWTTASVDSRIVSVDQGDGSTSVVIQQDGQMPSPVVLQVEFKAEGAELKPMSNAEMIDESTAIVTWPVDVWMSGERQFVAKLEFGEREITRITLDPNGRFPDENVGDNVWPTVEQ